MEEFRLVCGEFSGGGWIDLIVVAAYFAAYVFWLSWAGGIGKFV